MTRSTAAPIRRHTLDISAAPREMIRIGYVRTALEKPFEKAYGAIQTMLRAGAKPTGIRVTSFIDLMSTTETSLVSSLAT